jgi:AcrR family transcriptional regulator
MTGRRGAQAQSSNPQVLRTRRAIRDGLLAILARKPLDMVTNRELADAAGVGYATLFRHCLSKEDLLHEIAEEQITQIIELTVPILDAQDTRVACLALCRHVDEHRATWRALIHNAQSKLRDEFIRLAIARRPPKIKQQNSLSIELGAHAGVAATLEILAWWLRQPEPIPSAEIAAILDRIVVAPALAAGEDR